MPNNAINTDSEKQRSFVVPLFTAGYGTRSSALHADERVRLDPNIANPIFERHRFAATSLSCTRVPAAHHHRKNSNPSRRGGEAAPCGMTLNSRSLGNTANAAHPARPHELIHQGNKESRHHGHARHPVRNDGLGVDSEN